MYICMHTCNAYLYACNRKSSNSYSTAATVPEFKSQNKIAENCIHSDTWNLSNIKSLYTLPNIKFNHSTKSIWVTLEFE